MSGHFALMHASEERLGEVVRDVERGAEPHTTFYALMIASSLIASIGLIANSTAVIIGAMLVSPLMMPIFGISLAMVQGKTELFIRALIAEVVGILLATRRTAGTPGNTVSRRATFDRRGVLGGSGGIL